MDQSGRFRILSVFGTRPEAVKMAPVIRALKANGAFESLVAVTAQHREMLDAVLRLFAIEPDYDLNIMRRGQTLEGITAAALEGLCPVMRETAPDLVLVHGDTTTTFAGALAAFYTDIPVAHVEAGLRTWRRDPFPEEMNRRLTGRLADWHFAPTETAAENLKKENIAPEKIFVTGNTVIDALLSVTSNDNGMEMETETEIDGLNNIDFSKRLILLTCHRRENWGEPMRGIFKAVADVAAREDGIEVVFPVHKNPAVRQITAECLEGKKGIRLIEPLDYLPFCRLMKRCYLVLTDSGGLQEEAPALGKPVLVLREETERPEAVSAGVARLLGTAYESVRAGLENLLDDSAAYQDMAKAVNPFGDGNAARRIVRALTEKIIPSIKNSKKTLKFK